MIGYQLSRHNLCCIGPCGPRISWEDVLISQRQRREFRPQTSQQQYHASLICTCSGIVSALTGNDYKVTGRCGFGADRTLCTLKSKSRKTVSYKLLYVLSFFYEAYWTMHA